MPAAAYSRSRLRYLSRKRSWCLPCIMVACRRRTAGRNPFRLSASRLLLPLSWAWTRRYRHSRDIPIRSRCAPGSFPSQCMCCIFRAVGGWGRRCIGNGAHILFRPPCAGNGKRCWRGSWSAEAWTSRGRRLPKQKDSWCHECTTTGITIVPQVRNTRDTNCGTTVPTAVIIPSSKCTWFLLFWGLFPMQHYEKTAEMKGKWQKSRLYCHQKALWRCGLRPFFRTSVTAWER